MEYSTTQRGSRVFIYSGFEYLLQRTTRDVETWRCRLNRTSRCRASLKIKDNVIIVQPTKHCHDSCPQKIEANIAKIKMKQSIKAVGANPQNVIENVIMEMSEAALIHMPKKSSLSRNLHLHKIKNQVPNPTTLNFIIPEIYNELIIYDSGIDDHDRILALGNKDLLNELSKNVIFGDGTYDEVPTVFYKLYTWHAQVGNSYPPCIYFLLGKKNTITYRKMFEALRELVPSLNPQEIIIDFEEACFDAARAAFPFSEVKGSYFHLTQSLRKKINSVGLKSLYKSNIEIKLMLKSLAAIAYVPVEDINMVFNLYHATFPKEKTYIEILLSFFYTYIESVKGSDPQFPIGLWNHYGTALEQSPKTINYCEGYHNTLNSLFYRSHLSIWNLFDGLQRDITRHTLTLINAKSGLGEIKNEKYESLYNAVCSAVEEYHQTEDKLKYLIKLANLQ